MKIVIQTQIRENYGAHDWDGEGECPQYWKFKGGETYIIRDLFPSQVEAIMKTAVPTLTALIESRSEGWEEYILGFDVVEDSTVTHEPWETPFSLAWEGGRWLARRTIENGEYGYMRSDIEAKTEQYDMLFGGGRENYTCSYVMRNGREVTSEQLEQFYKEVA